MLSNSHFLLTSHAKSRRLVPKLAKRVGHALPCGLKKPKGLPVVDTVGPHQQRRLVGPILLRHAGEHVGDSRLSMFTSFSVDQHLQTWRSPTCSSALNTDRLHRLNRSSVRRILGDGNPLPSREHEPPQLSRQAAS